MNIFTAVKYCFILHGRVFVMSTIVSRIESLERDGVRFVYRENNTFANDAEPEFIAYNTDETKAYICLQVTACYHAHEVYTASNLLNNTFK